MTQFHSDTITLTHKIIDVLSKQTGHQKHALQSARHYLNTALDNGWNPSDMNYYLFNTLIQKEGIGRSLTYQFLKEFVSHPKFIHQQDDYHHPTETTMLYLAGTAYWFDKDLFNPMVITRTYNNPQNTPIERDLINLLDIGCILIQKGFQFPKLEQINNPEIGHYMQTYIQMVKCRLDARNNLKHPKSARIRKISPRKSPRD